MHALNVLSYPLASVVDYTIKHRIPDGKLGIISKCDVAFSKCLYQVHVLIQLSNNAEVRVVWEIIDVSPIFL